jgi:hypothetical protein
MCIIVIILYFSFLFLFLFFEGIINHMDRSGREPPSKRARSDSGGGIADDIMSRMDSLMATGKQPKRPMTAALKPGQRVINVVDKETRDEWHQREPQEHGYLVNQEGEIVDKHLNPVHEPMMSRNAEYTEEIFSRAEALRANPDYRTYSMVAGKLNKTLEDFLVPDNNPQIGRVTDQINRTLDSERRKRNLSLTERDGIIKNLKTHYDRLETQLETMAKINNSFEPTAARWSWLGSMTGYAMMGDVLPSNRGTWSGFPDPLPYWLLSSLIRPSYRDLINNEKFIESGKVKTFNSEYLSHDLLYWNMGEAIVPAIKKGDLPFISWVRKLYDAVVSYNIPLASNDELQVVYGLYVLIRDIYGVKSITLRPDTRVTHLPPVPQGALITTHVERIYSAINTNIRTRDVESSTRNDVNNMSQGDFPIFETPDDIAKASPIWATLHNTLMPIIDNDILDTVWGNHLLTIGIAEKELAYFEILLQWSLQTFTAEPVPIPMPLHSLMAWLTEVFVKTNNTTSITLGHQAMLNAILSVDTTNTTYTMTSRRGQLKMEISEIDNAFVTVLRHWLLFGVPDHTKKNYIAGVLIQKNQEDGIELFMRLRHPLPVSEPIATIYVRFPGSKPMVNLIRTLFPENNAGNPIRYLWLTSLVNYITWTTLFETAPETILMFYSTSAEDDKGKMRTMAIDSMKQIHLVLNEFDYMNDAADADIRMNQYYGMEEFIRELTRSTMNTTASLKETVTVEGPNKVEMIEATAKRPLQVPLIAPSMEPFYMTQHFLQNLQFNPPKKTGEKGNGVLLRQLEYSMDQLQKAMTLADIDAFKSLDRLQFNTQLFTQPFKVQTSPSFDVYFKQRLLEVATHLHEPGSVLKMFTNETDPMPYYFLNLLIAMGLFSGQVYPLLKQKTLATLEAQRQSILSAEEKYARLVDDDMSVAVGNIQDLVTKLYTPQQAYQFRAIISGRIVIPEMFSAAANATMVAIHAHVPSLKHVPYDVLVGNTEEKAEGRDSYINEEVSDAEAVFGLWVAFYEHISCNGTLIQRMHPKNYMTSYQQPLAQIQFINQSNVFHQYRAEPLEARSTNKKILQPWRITHNRQYH